MKKVGLIIFAIALIFGVVLSNIFSFGRVSGRIFNFSIGGVKGSGVIATETRDVADFRGIDVGGVFQVEVVAQKEYSVEIEADDNIVPLVKTYVSGGILKIESDRRFNPSNPVRIRVSAPDIESVEASGASKVSVSNLSTSGIRIDTSGASKVNLSGETATLSANVSGASAINAEELKTQNATVDASGASRVNVFVTGRLVADASGASKITYAGNPVDLEKRTSGASHISQK